MGLRYTQHLPLLHTTVMSFPEYDIAAVTGPGLLYVNSKITDPSLSPELYKKWYEEIHIRDIFERKGIASAFRYYSTSPDSVERPYLALYPLEDVSFLTSAAFKSIPVNSELLPKQKPIFEFADFDTRYYTHVKTISKGQSSSGEPQSVPQMCRIDSFCSGSCILTIHFDANNDIEAQEALSNGKAGVPPEGFTRLSLFSNYFARQNRNQSSSLGHPPKYLAIVEVSPPPGHEGSSSVAIFSLLRAFGDSSTTPFI